MKYYTNATVCDRNITGRVRFFDRRNTEKNVSFDPNKTKVVIRISSESTAEVFYIKEVLTNTFPHLTIFTLKSDYTAMNIIPKEGVGKSDNFMLMRILTTMVKKLIHRA